MRHLLFLSLLMLVTASSPSGVEAAKEKVEDPAASQVSPILSSEPPAHVSSEPPATVSFDLSEAGAIPEGVEAYLRAFFEVLSRRDVESAVLYFDPENRAAQRSIGLHDDAQYLLEGLGVSRFNLISGTPLPDRFDYGLLLESLEHIEVRGVTKMRGAGGVPIEGFLELTGELRFGVGNVFRMSLQLQQKGGAWVISPPLG